MGVISKYFKSKRVVEKGFVKNHLKCYFCAKVNL